MHWLNYTPWHEIKPKQLLYAGSRSGHEAIVLSHIIVFVWSINGINRTKAFVKGLLVPEIKIAGGATC